MCCFSNTGLQRIFYLNSIPALSEGLNHVTGFYALLKLPLSITEVQTQMRSSMRKKLRNGQEKKKGGLNHVLMWHHSLLSLLEEGW